MRRLPIALTPLLAAALLACEDGPTQTFSDAPAGAGDRWNDGKTPGAAAPGDAPFADKDGKPLVFGGTNKQELCTGDEKAKRWGAAFAQPIIPPLQVGGLNIAGYGSDNKTVDWHGLTIDEAEKVLCQSANDGDQFGDGTQVNQWGDRGEIWAQYSVQTRKIMQLTIFPGYTGSIKLEKTAQSRYQTASYEVRVGDKKIQRDGNDWDVHWNAQGIDRNDGEELFLGFLDLALQTSFVSPAVGEQLAQLGPDGKPQNCFSTGRCISGNFGDAAYFYLPQLGISLWIDNWHDVKTNSKPSRIDIFPAKLFGFSFAATTLKLGAEGPVARAGIVNKQRGEACALKFGLDWDHYLPNCVQTANDPDADGVELAKLFGGISHSNERFSFDVTGVDVNFTDAQLPDDDVIRDSDRPGMGDVVTQFRVDQSTLGRLANDYRLDAQGDVARFATDPKTGYFKLDAQGALVADPNGAPFKDLHGAGLVYLEYARAVQERLSKYLPADRRHDLGDPACLSLNGSWPVGCTGFEAFVTAAPPPAAPSGSTMDSVRLGVMYPAKGANGEPETRGVLPSLLGLGLGLKPGHTQAFFCDDLAGFNCPSTFQGDLFATSFARVRAVMGGGKVINLPTEVQDVRFFFKEYVKALGKYFTVAGTPSETVEGVHAAKVNNDDFFFDSVGAGQFEIGEYIDRSYASRSTPPMDIQIVADVRNGIFNSYEFSRDLFRGEEVLYAVNVGGSGKGLGETGMLMSNVFGSPLLKAAYTNVTASDGTVTTAYHCATTIDAANCNGQSPPLDAAGNVLLDDDGRPILAPYPAAFGAGTTLTLGPSPLVIRKSVDALEAAMIEVPLTKNPFDLSSGVMGSITKFVPWLPKSPGVGFPISVSGSRDKFIETAQLDLSGTTITANVDYVLQEDPAHPGDESFSTVNLLAVESTDFLGDVFLCKDSFTGDILRARMYTPVAELLNWLEAHPAAYNDCGLIIRYSPYGNFADYITSLHNGVRVGITQGGGYGRVVDAVLFVPGQ